MPEAEACWFCVCGLHDECIGLTFDDERTPKLQCCCYGHKGDDAEAYVKGLPGRPLSDPEDITDILSTGRKRAEQAAPILNGMECEWARLKFAGGGVQPIMGCKGNLIWNARANKDIPTGHYRGERHHFPDKNVLNNTPGQNLHRICSTCHKRSHSLNDAFYQGERPAADVPWLPSVPYFLHDASTEATDEEITKSEEWWRLPAEKRGPYPFELPDDSLLRQPKRLVSFNDGNRAQTPFTLPGDE